MIRPIDIRLNAAHPELPLAEAVTFTGSPSTVLVRGVPPNCGRWAITAVSVAALTVPYERAKTYLNILFMDDKKLTPSTGVNGLVIVENEDDSGDRELFHIGIIKEIIL